MTAPQFRNSKANLFTRLTCRAIALRVKGARDEGERRGD
jgi:hypothetical protein